MGRKFALGRFKKNKKKKNLTKLINKSKGVE